MAEALRIDLSFDFEKLVCKRTIVVPADITVDELHIIIQALGNWKDVQEYDFEIIGTGGLKRYEPDWQLNLSKEWGERNSSYATMAFKVADVVVGAISCVYHYSYGEDWAIKIEAEPVEWPDDQPLPALVGGEGEWPCEGVGGEAAFEHFLEVFNDEGHPEHEACANWAYANGFEVFGQDDITSRLSRWNSYENPDA